MKLKTHQIDRIKKLLKTDNQQQIIHSIQGFEAVDLAGLMASLDKHQSSIFLEALLSLHQASSILAEMPEAAF